MQNKYTLYNKLGGWTVFLISFFVYLITVEPTTSFWDSGEFIASAYKLEVGHPPGAPLYMLVARVFSLFAFSPEQVAYMVNMVSVVASAFTILFLFWTITHFAKKILVKSTDFPAGKMTAIIGSGAVGSLSYAFSDTFWFSAVEAEVYAASSLFTAFVVWAILKWESTENEQYANRWLILIAFVMGLSIGVHLLNLLTIPALVFVYYFKKHKTSPKGILVASGISILLLGFLMYGIIPQAINLATKFELLFVNDFSMPFGSGIAFYLISLGGILIFGIYYSHKKNKPIVNTILLAITVILIGYSSFSVIVIRSQADTPMNENQPDNVFSLLSYLNREQYGNRPLISGGYYDSKFKRDASGSVISEPQHSYRKGKEKYIKVKKHNPDYKFEDGETTLFPRMYSRNGLHVSGYRSWGGVPAGEKPTFVNNIRFFLKYQIGQMYFRYFMWNFSGRQNDAQGHGGITKGNWITGINFLDATMLGNQSEISSLTKNDKSRNKYFLLPFLLGLIGLVYSFSQSEKSFTVIMLLFFFTGIAIVLYLNQTPYQPRERDYAYAGSFYAFAIWIGLGTLAVFSGLEKFLKSKQSAIAATAVTAAIPMLMVFQNFDDHDRSGRYTARDFAKNYLSSCDQNAILFTYGDNDTFPLWYLQEVEGFRTDVRVVNLSLLGTDWYINQMQKKAYKSEALPFEMKKELYRKGKRDVLYLFEKPDSYINEKYFGSEIKLRLTYRHLYSQLLSVLSNSEYQKKAKNDFELLQKSKLAPEETFALISKMAETEQVEKFKFKVDAIAELQENANLFAYDITQCGLPLKFAMDFAASDDDFTKLSPNTDSEGVFLPSKLFTLAVNKENIKTIPFSESEKKNIESNIEFKLNKRYIYKDGLAVLEILARNNWERPIYFATSVGHDNFYGLSEYFRLEGFAYRLIPVRNKKKPGTGSINSQIMYDKMMQFDWGNIKDKSVLIESNNRRVISIMNIRETFARLSISLTESGEKEKAIEVLNRCMEELPEYQIPLDETIVPIIEAYFKAGDNKNANILIKATKARFEEDNKWYSSLSENHRLYISREKSNANATIKELKKLEEKYNK